MLYILPVLDILMDVKLYQLKLMELLSKYEVVLLPYVTYSIAHLTIFPRLTFFLPASHVCMQSTCASSIETSSLFSSHFFALSHILMCCKVRVRVSTDLKVQPFLVLVHGGRMFPFVTFLFEMCIGRLCCLQLTLHHHQCKMRGPSRDIVAKAHWFVIVVQLTSLPNASWHP